MNSLFDLSGHVAVVTGGNSGLGLGMAEGLAAAGASVCVWGTHPEKNEAALARISQYAGSAAALQVDVSDEEQVVAAMAEVVRRFGHLDSCFANAAITGQFGNPPFIASTLENWRRVMSVNLDGAYLTLREAARQMVLQGSGGSLVGTSSIAANFGAAREEPYAASKGGIVALIRALAVELAKYQIRANTLVPAWTMSPQTALWADNPSVAEKIMPRIPLGRWGEPAEWAGVAVYLASKASSFHTGDELRIDGGYSIF